MIIKTRRAIKKMIRAMGIMRRVKETAIRETARTLITKSDNSQ